MKNINIYRQLYLRLGHVHANFIIMHSTVYKLVVQIVSKTVHWDMEWKEFPRVCTENFKTDHN